MGTMKTQLENYLLELLGIIVISVKRGTTYVFRDVLVRQKNYCKSL